MVTNDLPRDEGERFAVVIDHIHRRHHEAATWARLVDVLVADPVRDPAEGVVRLVAAWELEHRIGGAARLDDESAAIVLGLQADGLDELFRLGPQDPERFLDALAPLDKVLGTFRLIELAHRVERVVAELAHEVRRSLPTLGELDRRAAANLALRGTDHAGGDQVVVVGIDGCSTDVLAVLVASGPAAVIDWDRRTAALVTTGAIAASLGRTGDGRVVGPADPSLDARTAATRALTDRRRT